MKYLILVIQILTTLSLLAQTEQDILNLTSKAVNDRADHFKVDSDILQAVIVAYIEPDSVGYVLKTEKGMEQRGTIWEVVHRTAKYMSIVMKGKRNCTDNIECWKHSYFGFIDIVPEHPMINLEMELHDTGKGYFKEVKAEKEPDEIIIINEPISATCAPGDESSICKWMERQKAKKSIDKMRVESLNYRAEIGDLEYEWQKLLIEFGSIISSELQDISVYDPEYMVDALARHLGQFESQTIRLKEKRGQYN